MGVRIPTDPIEKLPFVAYQIESWAGKTSDNGRAVVIAGLGYELARLVLKIVDEELIMPLLRPWYGDGATRLLAERIKTLAPDHAQHMSQIVTDSIELATLVCDYDRES